jgi:hypothetical protein
MYVLIESDITEIQECFSQKMMGSFQECRPLATESSDCALKQRLSTWSRVLEKLIITQQVKIFLIFLEPKSLHLMPLFPKISLQECLYHYHTTLLLSLVQDRHVCYPGSKLTSSTSVFSLTNCKPLTTLPPISLLLSSKCSIYK